MKKLLCIALTILMLVFVLASCATVKSMIIKHEVTFNLDGGVGGEGYAESVKIGDGKILSLPTPTREGYNFLGWYSGETKIAEDTPITSDMSLTAKWEIKTFTVTFLDYYGNTVSTETVNWGESATAPTVDSVIEKQKFNGWSADFSKVTEDMTVNALYVDNTYTISYDLGEVGESFTAPCFYGELPEIPETPVIDGYVFFGWYLDEELTERYFFDYKFDEDTTLYAKFYDTSLGEYIVISNVEQLMAIKDQPDAKYLLACDINCKGETLIPIDEFSGELEGNGYKIFNFSINETTNVSGFIRTNKGSILNLSFSDFTFDILVQNDSTKTYGLVAAVNEGLIDNCHILDSEFKLDMTAKNATSHYAGSIAGRNNGTITNSTNKAVLNVASLIIAPWSGTFYMDCHIGGISGLNDTEAVIDNCNNYGKINITAKASGWVDVGAWKSYNCEGVARAYIGGVVGNNLGKIASCSNSAEIVSKAEYASSNCRYICVYVGGAVGKNDGEIDSVYSIGNITQEGDATELHLGGFAYLNNGDIKNSYTTANITQSGNVTKLYFGGFAVLNSGKIYNCYTTTNFVSNANVATNVAGFVAENKLVSGYPATINKCFSTGSITLGAAPTECGYFIGKTTGTEKDCYYLDTMTINVVTKTEVTEGETTETVETVEPAVTTCTVGEAKTYSELTSIDFIENTLYFDRMIWIVVEGQLPTLR